MNLSRRLLAALLLLLLVIVVAALGYRLLAGPQVTILDAVYMALVTIASVGYSEIVPTGAHPALRIFNMLVILFGIGVLLYVFTIATAFIVEGELTDIVRRRKMLKQVEQLKSHIIVCGAGETAHHVVRELLRTGHRFVVIDHDPQRLEKVHHMGDFPVVKGEAADEEALESAGLARADGLVSVLPDDRDNLMVVVAARRMNPTVRIVARCTDARVAEMLMRAGANSAVSPNMIGGLRLASELIRPHVVGFLDQMLKEPQRAVRVEEIHVGEGSPWVGKTLHQTELHRRFGLLALAVRKPDGETAYNPQGETVLAPRDVVIVMGGMEQVWSARQASGQAVERPEA